MLYFWYFCSHDRFTWFQSSYKTLDYHWNKEKRKGMRYYSSSVDLNIARYNPVLIITGLELCKPWMIFFSRRSLSISVNSSLSDDPNASIESIADIPITLINPRYSHKGRQKSQSPKPDKCMNVDDFVCELRPMNETPRGRRSLREISGQSTPLIIR